jgi:hypothetical protein
MLPKMLMGDSCAGRTGRGATDQMCWMHATYKYAINGKHLHLRGRWQAAAHPICMFTREHVSAAANLSQSRSGLSFIL